MEMTSIEQDMGGGATPTGPQTILSDEPCFSSAALCLTLNHVKNKFRPEFTHQCVESEAFGGHKPLPLVIKEAKNDFQKSSNGKMTLNGNFLLHKSHLHHEKANNELDVQIQLAPSCCQCNVKVNIQKVKREITDISDEINNKQQIIKKQKIGDTANVKKTVSWNLDQNQDPVNSNSSLSESEIKQCISNALPQISNKSCEDDYLSEVVGQILDEYSVNDKDFVLCLAQGTSPEVVEYHNQVQKLALWFIENADDVNVSDNQSGFWKVLYLFQKQASGYSLVGYITLFHFNSPFHKPEPGIIVRICQALVLPSYQRQGHGKRMMQCVYDVMHGKYEGAYSDVNQKIIQINVEDPAPGFVALRNKVDMKLMAENQEWLPASKRSLAITDAQFFVALTETEAIASGAHAKITPRQIQIVNEVSKLQSLNVHSDNANNKEELERRFRLMVKRRLNKEHREDLSSYPTKDEKKAYLAKLFEEEYEAYQRLLGIKK